MRTLAVVVVEVLTEVSSCWNVLKAPPCVLAMLANATPPADAAALPPEMTEPEPPELEVLLRDRRELCDPRCCDCCDC